MTAGSYIKKLLEDKQISISWLSKQMGIKSRSTFYRLFNDYYSKDKTGELIDGIIRHIELTDEEKHDLESRFGTGRVSSFFKRTRDILLKCYDETLDSGYIVKTPDGEKSLVSLLKEHSGGEASVFLINLEDERVIGDIAQLLEWNERVKVYDYIKLRNHRIRTAYELMTLIRFFRYPNYLPVVSDFSEYSGICMVSAEGGKYNYMSVNIDNDCCDFVDTEINRDMYDHIVNVYTRVMSKGESLRRRVKKVSDYIELVQKSADFSCGAGMFYSEGAPCFGALSVDILSDMFRDINYFGFPYEHEYVQRLFSIFNEKAEYEANTDAHERRMMFDERHIEHMMRSGIAFDHMDAFRPMSGEQCRTYFKRLADIADKRANYSYRFIRRDIIRSPFVYSGKGILYLYAPGSGGGEGSSMFLERNSIREIMDDFSEYIWENHTCSEEESKKTLAGMADKYLK